MAPSDLREQLNELWKTTVDQFDEIKEVVVHNSMVGRKKLDAAFLKRQRDKLFQDLGELVFAAALKGALPLSPEAQRVVERIQDLLVRLRAEEAEIDAIHTAARADNKADDKAEKGATQPAAASAPQQAAEPDKAKQADKDSAKDSAQDAAPQAKEKAVLHEGQAQDSQAADAQQGYL